MKRIQAALLLLILAGCAGQPRAIPTLAILPTETSPPETLLPTEPSVVLRPTLPPTFTPTAPATATAPPPTQPPAPTLRVLPTSQLGLPLESPENFPIQVEVRGGGYALNLTPPPAVRYTLQDGVYRLTLAYAGNDYENLAVQLAIADSVSPGEYSPVFCSGTGASLPDEAPLCLAVSYTNDNLVAGNPASGGTVTLASLDPLVVEISAPLNDSLMPNTTSEVFNPAQNATITIDVDGQQRTEG